MCENIGDAPAGRLEVLAERLEVLAERLEVLAERLEVSVSLAVQPAVLCLPPQRFNQVQVQAVRR